MKFFFSRHPEWLLSVSPFLDGYLTVAAGFLIARVFLDCRRVFAFLDRQARNQFLAHVLCRTSRSLPCEPAAEISADEGLPTNTILALRRNRSFIETLSEGAFLLLRFLDVSDIAGDSRDVLLAGNFGKCDGQSQSAFSNHADLSGIPGGDVADVEIQPPTVGCGVLVWTFASMTTGLGGIACDPSVPVLGICFWLYAVAYGMQSTLDYSLLNQLFPTTVRTTAVGIVFAVSRVASGAAAAGFPLLLNCCNIPKIFVVETTITVAGIVVVIVFKAHIKS